MKTIARTKHAEPAAPAAAGTMKALVYRGPGKRAWEDHARPALQADTDAIVRVTTTTICGTDLHILKGDVPEVKEGRVMGHEGVGAVVEAGRGVSRFKAGDRVLISCITSCAMCPPCRAGMYSHCERGGWLLGHLIDGTQAEYARVPFADTSLHPLPKGASEAAMAMLSDIFPTGYECGVLNGRVKPGDAVVIVGAGPIGLAALMTAQFFAPARVIMIDPDANRLKAARRLGAAHGVAAGGAEAIATVLGLTGGRGAEVVIEAVGAPASFDVCQAVVAPGGTIANIGVHGRSVTLRLEKLWARNIAITTRLVDTVTTPMLLTMVESGRLAPEELVTHRFELGEMMRAYDVFGDAAREKALKVVLSAPIEAVP